MAFLLLLLEEVGDGIDLRIGQVGRVAGVEDAHRLHADRGVEHAEPVDGIERDLAAPARVEQLAPGQLVVLGLDVARVVADRIHLEEGGAEADLRLGVIDIHGRAGIGAEAHRRGRRRTAIAEQHVLVRPVLQPADVDRLRQLLTEAVLREGRVGGDHVHLRGAHPIHPRLGRGIHPGPHARIADAHEFAKDRFAQIVGGAGQLQLARLCRGRVDQRGSKAGGGADKEAASGNDAHNLSPWG